jgi:AraC-like DNA-binding protein
MHEKRKSSSPHIQFIWRSYAESSGSFNDIAHDFWVIVFRTLNERTEVILTGPVTKSQTISYKEGQASWGIVFKAHVFVFDLPKKKMLNARTTLEMTKTNSFLLGKHEIEIPLYEKAEEFVEALISRNILNANLAIAEALKGEELPMSKRTLQRQFLDTTGITKNKSEQIAKARKAFMLLQEGMRIADVTYDLGYADQAHLTRSLKLLSGQTPGQIINSFRSS